MGYEVRGGPGSIKYSIDELERTHSMLVRAGSELADGVTYLASAPRVPAAVLALGTFGLAARVRGAEASITATGNLCAQSARETGIMAAKVSTARMIYEDSEQSAVAAVRSAHDDLAPLAIMMGDLATNKGRPRTQTTEDLINQLPGYLGFPLEMLGDIEHGGIFATPFPQRFYPLLTSYLKDQNLINLNPIEVIGQSQERVIDFDGSIQTLTHLQNLAEAEPPGSVLVTRFQAPAGPLYILSIPGTQTAPLKDMQTIVRKVRGGDGEGWGNPWDGTGIIEGMGNESKNLMPSIEESLKRSGAQNGDRVIVTGYSQGGIHAVNIVNDERLRKLYRFSYLSTFGSPTGNVPVPPDTQALHVEDKNDLVPGTDGARNPDEKNRLTVIFDGPDRTLQLGNDGFGEAHKLKNYESHAKELEGSSDPGVVESLGLLGSLLGRSPRGRARSFQLARTPKPRIKVPAPNSKRDRIAKITPRH